MNYTTMRKLLLKVFIGFLSLTAGVAIAAVFRPDFGSTHFKILATAFSIAAGSICAMSCAAFLERNRISGFGFFGVLTAGIAVVMVIVGIWCDIRNTPYGKATVTFTVLSVAFAYGCCLRLPKLSPNYRWMQTVSTILIILVTTQIILAVWGEIKEDGYFRFMAATAIFVVLITLIIPICSKLGKNADEPLKNFGQASAQFDQIPDNLILRKVSTGVFADETGRRYQLTEIKAQPGDSPSADSTNVPPVA